MWKSTAKTYERRRVVTWVLLVVVLLLATALGAYAFGRSQSPAALEDQDRESLTLYAEALDTVREDYVDQEAIDSKKQTYGAIEGMLDTLGDEGHTRFLTPEEREQNREGLSGTYVGIGIQLEEEAGEVVVAAPIEGSPAERAGIEAGDVVVAVDGESVRGEEVAQVAEKVRGPEGTRVELTVLRGGEEREFDLERAEIESPVASWTMIPSSDVAFVRLASFSDTSAEKLAQAFEEARAAGARRFVLDLRDNPGGRLDQAVRMSGNFLEAGSVVYVREDASGEREEVEVEDGTEPIDAPMAVLVNEGTASSAEILAGALRDNERATVMGETTFGTGTVLSEFVLGDGSAILLGVAEWLTPDGDFIRETGIEPDVEVALAEDAEPLTPSDARDLSREEILDRDAQLSRAFENLQDQ
ncbi:MAG TPA: S41 family peptidase [Rubrobacteraceae bacterium]|nr:S41 family peptidase [Rubrobacteraceae bacterium]